MKDLRALDVLVAEHVMGWSDKSETIVLEFWNKNTGERTFDIPGLPHYSSDISAAWDVVTKMNAHFTFHLRHWNAHPPSDSWDCAFSKLHDADPESFVKDIGDVKVAICLGALKAKGINVSEWE